MSLLQAFEKQAIAWQAHKKGRTASGPSPDSLQQRKRLEAVLTRDRNDAGRTLQVRRDFARGGIDELAGVGMEVVVCHPHAQMLVDAPAGAEPAIPAAAASTTTGVFTQCCRFVGGELVIVVVRMEVTTAGTQVPAIHEVHAAIDANQPAAQGVGGAGLIDRLRVEDILHAEITEIDITRFNAQAEILRNLPAVAARQAVAGAAIALTLGEVEGTEVLAETTVATACAADIGVNEPVARTDRLAWLEMVLVRAGVGGGVAGAGLLCECRGDSNETSGRNGHSK